MAKSKSERMKEYRARKKEQLGEKWLEWENERIKKYFVPMAELHTDDKEIRRERNKTNAQTFYYKHKKNHGDKECANESVVQEGEPIQGCSSTECDDTGISSTTTDNTMTVKFPFSGNKTHKAAGKKRVSRALKRSYQRIETLEDKNEELQRKLKTAQKRLQRYDVNRKQLTPRSKSDSILKESGVDPRTVPEVRKRLIYGEVLNHEVKSALNNNVKNHAIVQKVISGKIVKKYRLKSFLHKMTSVSRKKHSHDKDLQMKKRKVLTAKSETIKSEISNFFNRDDNSRTLPGKADAVKINGSGNKLQKKVLNDYMHNLHLKFRAEASYSVSLSTFCRYRPKNINLVNFTSRSICLCSKHQNFGFKLRCMSNLKVTTCTSPDTFVDLYKHSPGQLDELLQKVPSGKVTFQQWKRVKMQNGKERMRIIDTEMPRNEFITTTKKEFDQFVSHVERVTKQYKAVKEMKENLPKNHVLVQMDFSENYNCQTLEEIQSAYWNASMVTLHPTIVYYNADNGTLCHKSLVFVSEVLHHNAAMVSAIINKIVKTVKTYVPDLEYIHFWTDSPSSQYRNKSIFDLVNRFQTIHKCKASWHYFESGHGKSACDGVGGTTKRNADNAVKQSKAVIQDTSDFFAWATSSKSEIEYQMITVDEYEESSIGVEQRKQNIKPLKGTMAVHAIAENIQGGMIVRNTTCVCEQCFSEKGFNGKSSCNWETAILRNVESNNENQKEEQNTTTAPAININTGDYVVATYDGKCYVGTVLEVDDEDDTVHINFMVASGKVVRRFRWPTNEDIVWIPKIDVLQSIDKPIATGKAGRIYTVPDDVIDFMESQDKQ